MIFLPRSNIDAVAFGAENHTIFFCFIPPLVISSPLEPERLYFHQGIDELQTVGTNHRLKSHGVVPINPSIHLGSIAAIRAEKIIKYPHRGRITDGGGTVINKNPEFAVRELGVLRSGFPP